MKKIIFFFFVSFISVIYLFSQGIFVEIRKNFKDNYFLKIKVDTIFSDFLLDRENSYASIVDRDSIDLGLYDIFHFNEQGFILGEFIDKNPNEIKFVRLNLIFMDSIFTVKEQKSFYYELYLKEKRFLLDKDFLDNKELKVYFNDNMLSRALIWNYEGKLVSALDIYSGVSEKIDFLHLGVYFLTLSGFKNTERILIR